MSDLPGFYPPPEDDPPPPFALWVALSLALWGIAIVAAVHFVALIRSIA